jgi:rubrerythrin
MGKSIKGTQTEKNLLKAFAGESQARNRYEFFMKLAKTEGYEQIASIFQETADQEKEHEKRYRKLLKNLEDGSIFLKDGKVWWKCRKCGYIYEGEKALDICPACQHPKAFMQLKEENY